jgi:hypothetical protein
MMAIWTQHLREYKAQLAAILKQKKTSSSLTKILKQSYIRIYEESVVELWREKCSILTVYDSMGAIGERVMHVSFKEYKYICLFL